MKYKLIPFIALLFASTAFAGWFTSGGIDLVKEGALKGYESASLGDVFNTYFDGGKWEKFKSESGQVVVQFTGTISEKLHKKFFNYHQHHITMDQVNAYLAAARVNMTQEDTAVAWASPGKDAAEVNTKVLLYYMDHYMWKAGSKTTAQFFIVNDNFQLHGMFNDTWDSNNLSLIFDVLYAVVK